jgi:hypothetical protein
MPNTEASAWWSEVQHLRPEEDAAAPALRTGRFDRHRGDDHVQDRRAAEAARPHAGAVDRDRERRASRRGDDAASRTTRAAAQGARPPRTEEPHLRRSDAAGFAAALDLEGAFAAPAATGRTIVLERERRPARDGGERPTVQITGHPGAALAPRAARGLEPRRPRRRTVDRFGAQPDRVLMWAVLLGLFLVVLATTSGPG